LRSLGDQIDKQRRDRNVANEKGLTSLAEDIRWQGNGGGRRQSTKRSPRRRRARRTVVICLVLVLVLVVGGAGDAYYVTHDLSRVTVNGLNGALTTGTEAGSENILMMGSTSRCALTVQNPAYGLCSEGVNGVNSDVIMILHADPVTHQLALLSIPRDLFIPNARAEGANKIDAGLYEGPTQLVASIKEDFGIPIQHTVEVNLDQFANIVNVLGGINMSFPMSLFDANSGLNVQAATCLDVNGTQALQVVRARELQYDDDPTVDGPYARDWPKETQSDLAQIRRDHELLRVLAAAVSNQGLGNPITDLDLINSVKSDLTFDAAWPVSDMENLVLDFHSVNINSVPQLTMPVSVAYDPDGPPGSGDYEYEGSSGSGYGDVEFPSEALDQSVFDQVLDIKPSIDSMTGQPLPAPSSVTVSVQNGTGIDAQADDTATALSALGFDATAAGDVSPVGDLSETVVNYGSRTPAIEAAAEAVTRSMSGAVIMAYDPSKVTAGAQVTVDTGMQFSVNAPVSPRRRPPLVGPASPRQRHPPPSPQPHPRTRISRPLPPAILSCSRGNRGPAQLGPSRPRWWPIRSESTTDLREASTAATGSIVVALRSRAGRGRRGTLGWRPPPGPAAGLLAPRPAGSPEPRQPPLQRGGRGPHDPAFAAAHLRQALSEVVAAGEGIVGQPAVNLVEQAPRSAGTTQVGNKVTNAVEPVGIEEQSGPVLVHGQHALGRPVAHRLLRQLQDVGRDDRAHRGGAGQFGPYHAE
jgi:LCP family protein required for cell wall assembly